MIIRIPSSLMGALRFVDACVGALDEPKCEVSEATQAFHIFRNIERVTLLARDGLTLQEHRERKRSADRRRFVAAE